MSPAANTSVAAAKHETSGQQYRQKRADESYDHSKQKTQTSKYKIEYQPAKKNAMTRKSSKVSTLVNSLVQQ